MRTAEFRRRFLDPVARSEREVGRHPDFGRLIRDESTDTVVCHVCGRGFRSLGAHVRVHDLTATEYRREFGLLRSRALSGRSFTHEQSRTRRARYLASQDAQERFAAGRAMARSGELAHRRWADSDGRGGVGNRADTSGRADTGRGPDADPDEARRVRRESLAAGRRTQARTADERTAAALRAAGFTDLAQALRTVYVEREHSIEETARVLALGKGRLRRLLGEHGIEIRPSGRNSTTGRHARVLLNDRAAAERVGTEDITAWLRERTTEGATLRELAAATGRSVPWVAARIGPR
ncbi:MucR family transcriptional regulator [Streptomyces antibioticus]|uniref:MucR family transcriptional regulator n=1 Tax=Streptomyces antibioticus TaxID=1890 RepID=UPI00225AEB1B|nr:MucR family transcriptional regulator [Streptomyces antibioticus]MCX4743804.1 MucR family transcriptional regulator [Streptomyces antibioticus]